MKKWLKIILLVGIALLLTAFLIVMGGKFWPKSLHGASIKGVQLRSQIWSGTIQITDDVIFPPWLKVTIEPGTKILFDKKPDIEGTGWTKYADAYIKDHNDPTGREGYGQSHFELAGKVSAIGTKDRPIIFTSAQAKPEYADWDQLVALRGSRFEYIELSYAHNGLNINGDNVTVKNSQIHDSLWSCVDIFSTDNVIENNKIYHCWHQGIGVKVVGKNTIKNNVIHDAQLSVNCENRANPILTTNSFEAAPMNPDCPQGTNNTETNRRADTAGGTYDGQLIYPANQ